jgi:pentatricopeptide repeat protein
MGDLRFVGDFVADFGDADVSVDEPTYRELMWAYAKKGHHEPARAVFARMVAAGITPDERHHKALEWASGETKRRLDGPADGTEEMVVTTTTPPPSPTPPSPTPPSPTPPEAPHAIAATEAGEPRPARAEAAPAVEPESPASPEPAPEQQSAAPTEPEVPDDPDEPTATG